MTIQQKLRYIQQREEMFGKGKDIIHIDHKGYKIVAVGNELHFHEKWKTFPDFLGHYLRGVLGQEWENKELQKPLEQRHEILKWYDSLCKHQARLKPEPTGIYQAKPSGAMKAWYQLAYDLYTIRHNTELQNFLLMRLKSPDQFQGALYEANVTAILIRAGYDIEFEDETDRSSKHPEFIATNAIKGYKIAIEAKSRHRPGILGQPGTIEDYDKISVDSRRILNKAFSKQSELPFIVFINVNVPPTQEVYQDCRWIKESEQIVATKERRTSFKSPFPASAIIFTNTPYYWELENEINEYGWAYGRHIEHPKIPLPAEDIVETLVVASKQNGNIPNEFPPN